MVGYALVSFLSFSAGAVFAAAMLRPRTRRGGYVMPPASSTTRAPTAEQAATSFGLRPRLGLASAVEVGPATLHAPSNTGAHGASGRGTGGLWIGPIQPDSAGSDDAA